MKTGLLEYRLMKRGEEAEVCDLVIRVFDEFVAPQFSREGVQEFYNYADPHLFIRRSQWNHFVLIAAAQKEIDGMIEVRDDGHITLFFVDKRFQGKGTGKELLYRALGICQRSKPELSKATVNSSPNAVGIYERLGFRLAGSEQAENRIRFVPMVLDLFRHQPQLTATGKVKQKMEPSTFSDSIHTRLL
ncbi:MAG TPA: GNAT family N-acetyltransferase [Methanotrichaceae archaeon]|nr:GNAT family N-acetyltransferase [Methanotrichaceae archaeon]